tara:strand:- start:32 stop:493 length:462 start_codon:yes stop_codon:yes gene_type:complete
MAEEKYLKQYEKSATGNYLLRSRGTLKNIITQGPTAKTFTQEESGSVVMVTMTGGDDAVYTLPALKAGLNFKFINCLTNAGAGDAIITSADADTIVAISVADSGADGAKNLLADTVTIEAAATGGEVIEFECDGSFWYCTVVQDVIGSVTFAG